MWYTRCYKWIRTSLAQDPTQLLSRVSSIQIGLWCDYKVVHIPRKVPLKLKASAFPGLDVLLWMYYFLPLYQTKVWHYNETQWENIRERELSRNYEKNSFNSQSIMDSCSGAKLGKLIGKCVQYAIRCFKKCKSIIFNSYVDLVHIPTEPF